MDHSYDWQHGASTKKRNSASFPLNNNESSSSEAMLMDYSSSFESPLKRIRHSDLLLETPPLSQSCIIMSPPSSSKQQEEVVWWKKKQPRTNRSDACAVCQRVLSTTTTTNTATTSVFHRTNACIHDSRGMRDTSLLTYFLPNTAGNERMLVAASSAPNPLSFQQQQQQPSDACCAFCEKNVCADCIASCEECNYMYCKFCRTVDYDTDGFSDRILCIDCNSEKARSSSSAMEDAMHIG